MVRILYNSKFTLTSKIAWNKQWRYKEGWLHQIKEGSGSVVECLTRDFVIVQDTLLVQHRKSRPNITEKLLTGK